MFNLLVWNQNAQLQIFIQANISVGKKYQKPAKKDHICLLAFL